MAPGREPAQAAQIGDYGYRAEGWMRRVVFRVAKGDLGVVSGIAAVGSVVRLP